jgi:Tfp pilus assembly protein PilF
MPMLGKMLRFVLDYRLAILACGVLLALTLTGCGSSSPPAQPLPTTTVSGDVIRNPELAHKYTGDAYSLISEGKYSEALPLVQRAIAADPMFGPAHNDLGLVYFHMDRLYEAAWEFENASKLLPRAPEPMNNLGLVLEKARKLREAEKSYTDALTLDPDNVEYAGNLARIRIRLDERDLTTRGLLQLIVEKDTRPEWVIWAQDNLSRTRPTSQSAESR